MERSTASPTTESTRPTARSRREGGRRSVWALLVMARRSHVQSAARPRRATPRGSSRHSDEPTARRRRGHLISRLLTRKERRPVAWGPEDECGLLGERDPPGLDSVRLDVGALPARTLDERIEVDV